MHNKFNTKAVIIIILVVIAALASVLWLQAKNAEIRHKKEIDTELANTITPPTCQEIKRSYNQGDGADSYPIWNISYGCTNTLESVYKSVKDTATGRGYKIEGDRPNYNNDGQFVNDRLCLSKDGYYDYWNFDPSNDGGISLVIYGMQYGSCI